MADFFLKPLLLGRIVLTTVQDLREINTSCLKQTVTHNSSSRGTKKCGDSDHPEQRDSKDGGVTIVYFRIIVTSAAGILKSCH